MIWLRRRISRQKMEVDLDKELRFHFESQVADKIRSGTSESEARRLTRLEFGGIEQIKENCRGSRGTLWLESIVQDFRYGLRQLRKSPGFTLAAVTTLALGIGATTAIFSVVDSLLLRPLPYPNAPRIVRIWMTFAPHGMMEIPASEPEYLEYRQSRSFTHVAGFSVGTLTLTGTGNPLHLAASWGTSDFFSIMGTAPFLGRVFTNDEQQQGHAPVVVLSHRLWQNRFASSREIIGRSILLNGQSCTVVGVMPQTFKFPSDDVDVWQPLPIAVGNSNVGNHYLNLIADLKPQAALEQARAEMPTVH